MSPEPGVKQTIQLALVVLVAVIVALFVDRTVIQPVTDKFVGRLKV
jgi:hypothetical protein